MIGSISASVAGLQNVSKRVETAAQNIAKSNTTGDANGASNDPTQDIIDIKIASHDFAANLKVIKTQDTMTQSLLNILA